MKLSELAVKPKLSKVTITEEHIVEKYGEELDFYIWDRQPLDIFAKLSTITDEEGRVTKVDDILHVGKLLN